MVGAVGDFTLQSMGWTIDTTCIIIGVREFEVKCGQCGRKVNWSKSTGLGELVAISLY